MIKNGKCFWHPKRVATHIVNLGSSIDLDTSACAECVAKIETVNQFTAIDRVTIKSMRDTLESEGG